VILLSFAKSHLPELVIGRWRQRLENLYPAMRDIVELLRERSMERFEARGGGDWPPLADSTRRWKARRGYTDPLVNTASLKNSVDGKAFRRSAFMFAAGPAARIHQFGGMAGRGHKVKIPARPYLVVDDRARRAIGQVINDYVAARRAATRIRF